MDGLANILEHPLLILVVGGVLSAVLAPRFAQRLQDRRKSLELKATLIERLTQAATEMFTATQFAQVGATSQDQAAFDAAYRDWQRSKAVINALLDAYFRDRAVNEAWLRCRAVTTAYYVQTGIADEARREAYLRRVAAGLDQAPPQDWSEEVIPTGTEPEPKTDLTTVSAVRTAAQAELRAAVNTVVDARMKL